MKEAKLYFKYGVMSSGKTRDLQMNYHSNMEDGKSVIIMKPKIDTKGEECIKSRDNQSNKVDYLIGKEDNIYILITKYILENNLDVILVDEAQFLSSKQIDELSDIVDYLNIDVICYGIRVDFLSNCFNGGIRLFEIADVREELTKKCVCGNIATCNIRFDKDNIPTFTGDKIAIDGESYTYKTMCRKCAKTLRKKYNNKN